MALMQPAKDAVPAALPVYALLLAYKGLLGCYLVLG